MSQVFADAFYFIARLNRRDQHHERVVCFPLSSEARLITTEWVLLEVADGLANSEIRPYIKEVIRDLRHSQSSEVVLVSSTAFEHALAYYDQHKDKQWTLTDCTSFIVMRERGITEALTGDRHFEQAGFTAMLK